MKKEEIDRLKEVIYKAGEMAKNGQNSNIKIKQKSDDSPVTNVDLEISDYIEQEIKQLNLPYPIICEEKSNSHKLNFIKDFWLIDPIDGTRSYIDGKDTYTVNIGLVLGGVPKFGFVYAPAYNKLYFTDHALQLKIEFESNEINYQDNSDKNIFKAVSSAHEQSQKKQKFFETMAFNEILYVSSSLKLCMIASGEADIFPKFGPSMLWDIAAGHALITASKGLIRDINNMPISYNNEILTNKHFIAFSKKGKILQDKVFDILQS